jgi:hypothetical protein
MGRKIILLAGLALIAGLGSAEAQNTIPYATEYGRVLSGPLFDGGRRLLFSQTDNIYGTARSAAMGGAFASLGADLSSMGINPAGLGMYQSSDWGFTTALSIDHMKTTAPGVAQGNFSANGNRTSFGLNNIGAAFNVYDGSGSITSVTLGIAYNRAANFNARTRIDSRNDPWSIGDAFAGQLNYYSQFGNDYERNLYNILGPNNLDASAKPFYNENIDLEWWGAALGYQTGVIGHFDDGDKYDTFAVDMPQQNSYFNAISKGGISHFDFSIGANMLNKLYLGATITATDINYTEDTTYGETFKSGSPIGKMWYDQHTRIRGGGITAKLGIIARPVEALRIGVAFHLPTWYTVEKSYTGTMGTYSGQFNTGDPLMDELSFRTAPKLMAGVSGIIAQRAIVAFDWEVAWHNSITMRNLSTWEIDDSRNESRDLYKPAHTLRLGVEYVLSDLLSLRAGGAYMFDFMRMDDIVVSNPAMRNGFSVTAGGGFKLGRNGYLDVAYVYNRARMSDYSLYYFSDPDGGNARFSPYYSSTRHHHMISLTLGCRF